MGSIGTTRETPSTRFNWRQAVKRKRQELADRTPKEWMLEEHFLASLDSNMAKSTLVLGLDIPRRSGVMAEKELEITERYTACRLLEQIRSGALTSLEVTIAFC